MKELQCKNCGASFIKDTSNPIQKCPYCGSVYFLEEEIKIFKDEEIKFLKIEKGEEPSNILEIFNNWLCKGIFRPRNIKNKITIKSKNFIYAPVYVFNIYLESYWDGEYSVTKYRRVNKTRSERQLNGSYKTVYYEEDEPYKEWYRHNGKHSGYYIEYVFISNKINEFKKKIKLEISRFKDINFEDIFKYSSYFEVPNMTFEEAEMIAYKESLIKEKLSCASLTERLIYWDITSSDINYFLGFIPITLIEYKYKDKYYKAIFDCYSKLFIGKKPLSCIKILITILLIIILTVGVIYISKPYISNLFKEKETEEVIETKIGIGHVIYDEGVPLREEPDTKSNKVVDELILPGIELTVIDRQGDWIKVKTSNGDVGWCRAELGNEILVETIPLYIEIINEDGLTLKEDHNYNSNKIEILLYGNKYESLDRYKNWYKIKTPDGKVGWISGIGGNTGTKYIKEIY